jgi:hypothetical protein
MKHTQYKQAVVGRDVCRLGIAPLVASTQATARYPETTQGIAPYKTFVTKSS